MAGAKGERSPCGGEDCSACGTSLESAYSAEDPSLRSAATVACCRGGGVRIRSEGDDGGGGVKALWRRRARCAHCVLSGDMLWLEECANSGAARRGGRAAQPRVRHPLRGAAVGRREGKKGGVPRVMISAPGVDVLLLTCHSAQDAELWAEALAAAALGAAALAGQRPAAHSPTLQPHGPRVPAPCPPYGAPRAAPEPGCVAAPVPSSPPLDAAKNSAEPQNPIDQMQWTSPTTRSGSSRQLPTAGPLT